VHERAVSRERLEHKKRGAREGPPFFFRGVAGLKKELEAKLQLPHSARGTRRVVVFDVADPAGVSAAINARVALRAAEGKHRMIKYVVRVETELCLVAFRDVERLGYCQV